MQRRFDQVYFQGKIENVFAVLSRLKIPKSSYYIKRSQGLSAQEAFDYCISLKQKKEKRQGINVSSFSKENQVSKHTVYYGLNQGKSPQEILIDYADNKEKYTQFLNELYKQGLPKEYASLYEFCNQEGLNESAILKNLFKGMSFYDAVKYSFGKQNLKVKYVFYGIQMRSLCQKYQIDYTLVVQQLKRNMDFISACERVLLVQSFKGNIGSGAVYFWNVYQNVFLKGLEIQEKRINNHVLEIFTNLYYRMQHLKRDFAYYQFLESLDIFYLQDLSVDHRVQYILMNTDYKNYSLCELYYILDFEHGLMSDYLYLADNDLWVYKGNRKVLEKIKPSS